jgi:hypothetical protein
VEFNLWVGQRHPRLYVARVERLDSAAMQLDVLLRH